MLTGQDAKQLVYVMPDDDMAKVVRTLSQHKCSMAPILSADPGGSEVSVGGVGWDGVGVQVWAWVGVRVGVRVGV